MTLTELLSKLTEEDKKYLQQNAKNEKDFYDYFVTKGLTDSYEEFTAYLSQLKKLSSGEKELTDADLEKVAGGYNDAELQAMYDDYVANWQPGIEIGLGAIMPMPFDLWKVTNMYHH